MSVSSGVARVRSARGRARALLLVGGVLGLGGLFAVVAQAVAPPAYDAAASLTPGFWYIGDSAGSVYEFTVKNTGSSASIGAVEISRPSSIWTVSGCPTPPPGWSSQRDTTKCRFRSAPTSADDIQPGQSKVFKVAAKTAAGNIDRTGTWPIVVSRTYHFDNISLLKTVTPYGSGLTSKLNTFELTTAVVSSSVATPGAACPAANKDAIVGSTQNIVVCGKNRANVALTPIAAYSSLGGTFIQTPGAFSSGVIPAGSGDVVLGQWTGTSVTASFGSGKTVITQIGSWNNRTSPLRTFTGYNATSQPPVAVDDANSTNEDTLLSVTAPGVLANDTDNENDPLTAILVTDAAHGDLTLNSDGSYSYDPDDDFNGTDTFTYKANDGHSDSNNTATVTITVNAVNDAPVATDDAQSVGEDSTGATVSVLGNDTDVDGDTLSVTAVDTTGTTGSVTNNGTDVTYDPNGQFEYLTVGQTATDTFTYTASDGHGGTDTATVTITVTGVNDPPVANDDTASSADNATSGPISVLANDTDAEGAVTVTAVGTPANGGSVTNNGDGTVTYDPNGAFDSLQTGESDTDTFTYTIADGNGATDTATVTVTINGTSHAPVANDDAANVGEDSTGSVVTVLGNDTDADDDTLTVTAVDTTGTTGSVTNNGTDVTYDPNGMFEYLGDTQTATDTFTYTVSDGHGGTDTATVTITVVGDNDAPVANDDSYSTDEATSFGPTSLLINDTDAEGAVTITSIDTTGTAGTVTNHNDGTVTYNPNGQFEDLENGESRQDTFTYTITDAQGLTDTATVTVTVNGINDAPVANDDAANVGEDSTGATVNVLGNDTDAESQTLTVTAVDTTGTTGSVTNNGTDVTYDPNGMFEYLGDGQTATDVFTYTTTDSQGGTDTATVTITVVGDNDAPVANDDSFSTDEATSFGPTSLLINDTDAEGAVTITSIDTTGTAGTVTNHNDGTITYDPNGQFEDLANGESEQDTFTYTITDAQGGTDTATVTVTVNGINDAPVANDDAASAAEDSTGTTVDVLGNDTDAESQTLTVTGVDTTGTTGSVTNNGTDVTYDPNGQFEYLDAGQTATDTFTYTTTDSQGGTDTATVTVTVNGANDAPVAYDDQYQAIQDTQLVVAAPGVLTNDTDADTSDTLTAGNASTPAHGDVTLNADGSFTYTPDSGYLGPDSFTYDVSDGTATDTATVALTVVTPNATPTADATSGSGNEDGGAIVVTLTGHDADGDTLTFSPGTATNGVVSVPGVVNCSGTPSTCTTTVTYTPNVNFFGTDSFTYTVDDGTVSSSSALASLTVNAVNDEPSFTKGANQTVNEDAGAQTVSGWATGISSGPANESAQVVTLVATTNNDPLFSVLPAVNSAGDLTYTPAANANGVATVTIKATDDGGTSNGGDDTSPDQTFTITVNAVNDVPSFTKGANQTLNEDAGAQSVSGWATAISKGPADESGQTVSFTVTNDNNALFSSQPAVSPTGTLTYTSAANAVGVATVTVSLSDNGGTANGGDDTSDAQTFTITVNGVNDEPSFTHDGNQTVLEDAGAQTVTGFVNTTSAGPADESSQVVTVSVTGTNNNALFSALPSIDSAGTLTYTPAANANGVATVTAHATDDGGTANGGDDTGPDMTFTITVTAVNDAPSFTKGADQTLNEDAGAQSVSGWATAISKGPADESTQTVTFSVSNNNNALFSSQPAVSPTGTLTYTSAANKWGSATVTLSISDNGGTANGGDDTSDTQTFTITVNAVNDAPVAAAKAFTVQANMKISLGGLLTGATDPSDVAGDAGWTPTFTLGSITPGAGCVGCTISNVDLAAGTFDFDPPAGGTGTYTVGYTVVDNGYPAPGVTSASQTITFTVSGPVIWFVNPSVAVTGTGRLSAPFKTLAEATTQMGSNANHRIFVTGGNVSGNVTLPTDGWLVSEAATGTSFDNVMNITPPAGTIARPAVNGTQRTLTGGVTLGTNSVVRGFNLTPASGTAGLVASGKSGLVVNQVSVTTTSARAVDLASSSGTISLVSVSSTGASRGISLDTVNASTGSFTVTGTGTAGTGGTITTSTGDGIYMNASKSISLDRMVVSNSTGNGVYGNNVTTFTMSNSTLTNNGTNAGLFHAGIHFDNILGTSSISNLDVSGSEQDNGRFINTSGTANLTISGSQFHGNDPTNGAAGLYVDAQGSSVMTFTSTNNTAYDNRINGFSVFSQTTGSMTSNVSGGSATNNGNVGYDIESNGTGKHGFTVNNIGVTGCSTCNAGIHVYKGTGATGTGVNAMAGTISNNTVDGVDSQAAPGIWVHGEGAGQLRIAVTGNTVHDVQHRGIYAALSNGGGNLEATITGNNVNLATAGALAEIGILVESGVLSGDTVSTCADIKTNTVVEPNATDIRVRNRQAGTTLRLPGYSGGGTDTTAVAAFLLAQNTAADASASVNGNTIGGGGLCTAP